jgi:hypothetical protein
VLDGLGDAAEVIRKDLKEDVRTIRCDLSKLLIFIVSDVAYKTKYLNRLPLGLTWGFWNTVVAIALFSTNLDATPPFKKFMA